MAACAVTAFWGQCRLGELLPSTLAVLLSVPFPTRSHFKRSLRNPHSCILHLPRTKTRHHSQDVILVDQHPSVNPISLLKIHLRTNIVPNDAHIFLFVLHKALSLSQNPCSSNGAMKYGSLSGTLEPQVTAFGSVARLNCSWWAFPQRSLKRLVVGPQIPFSVIGDHLMILPLITSAIYILSSIGAGVVRRPPFGASHWLGGRHLGLAIGLPFGPSP